MCSQLHSQVILGQFGKNSRSLEISVWSRMDTSLLAGLQFCLVMLVVLSPSVSCISQRCRLKAWSLQQTKVLALVLIAVSDSHSCKHGLGEKLGHEMTF